MNAGFLTAVAALFLAVSTVPCAAEDFRPSTRPAGSLFDPDGLLPANAATEISARITGLRGKDGIDVMVVILKQLGGARAEDVANRFAAAWTDSPLHAVVLHVPGSEDAPWIVPGGSIVDCVKAEVLVQTVTDAMRRAAREPDDASKVRAAVTEATDMLRYWMGTALEQVEIQRTERLKIRLEEETKARQTRVAVWAGAGVCATLFVGVLALFLLLRHQGPRFFPETPARPRFGAPHAGGNHAVTDLGPPASRSP